MPPRPPLAGRTALLLRSADRAAPTLAELASRGAATVLCPVIDFELPVDTTVLDDGLRRLHAGGFDWLLLTSGTTVLALLRRAADLGLARPGGPLPVPGRTRVAVVGQATADAAAAAGLPIDVVPAHDHSARGMLAEWPVDARPGPASTVFMPQADIAAPTLAEGLHRWGAGASVATAYRTVDAPADPARRLAGAGPDLPGTGLDPRELAATHGVPEGVEAVLFTSPSIVRRYLALAGAVPSGVAAVAIGDSTAAELHRHGWEPAATAVLPTPAGLADAWERAVLGAHDGSPPPHSPPAPDHSPNPTPPSAPAAES